ncbi:MAG: hypothetical protein RIT07_862 [Bacteroidota bacterium]
MLLKIAVLLGCLIPLGVFAQDVEQVLKSKPIKAGGSVQMQQMFNHSLDGGQWNQPYNYVLSGNLNLTFFGVVHAPLQMLFSNMGNQFSQPTFNQTALHPQYKWLQLHMGRIAINWSPQTVGGHVFQGVATDLTPGKWTLSALYGRFQKAISAPMDSLTPEVTPVFRRIGYGFRVGHRLKNAHWQATYFKAADDSNSLNPAPFLQLTPQSNHVIGLLTDQVLFKKLMLNATYNVSYLQNDMRVNQSPARKQHYKGGLAWQGKVQRWNLTYEYTDPEYRTLGAYYFNNDMENISAGTNLTALKGKLNLSGQAGLQRDNLDNRKNASMRRRVYSLQGQYRLGKSGMISGAYSSFTSFTNTRTFTDYLQPNSPMLAWDTLNFREVSESGNVQLSLPMTRLGKWQGSINGNGLWQRNAGAPGSNSDFYNAGMGVVARHADNGSSLALQMNAGQNMAGELKVRNWGPVFSCSVPLMNKKWLTALSYSRIISEVQAVKTTHSSGRFQLNRNWKTQSIQAMLQIQRSPDRGFIQATIGYQVVVK